MKFEELLKGGYGNDKFEKHKSTIVFERITTFKDKHYSFPYFDALTW